MPSFRMIDIFILHLFVYLIEQFIKNCFLRKHVNLVIEKQISFNTSETTFFSTFVPEEFLSFLFTFLNTHYRNE